MGVRVSPPLPFIRILCSGKGFFLSLISIGNILYENTLLISVHGE
ncbi:hypothetical protein HMPREF9538_05012 [Klebsiella sp. MS 92-3]|nr:hypothetical protein HMPREF9538_05012 [Klebsiella sp. MS 92-3]